MLGMDINVLKATVMIGDTAMLNQQKPSQTIHRSQAICMSCVLLLYASNGAISAPSNGVPTRAERHEPFGSRHINFLGLS